MNALTRVDPPRWPPVPCVLVLLATLCVFASRPAAATAQAHPAIEPGEPLRVRWTEGGGAAYGWPVYRRATLDLVSVDGSYLVGTMHGKRVAIPLAAVSSIQRRVGTKPTSAPAMVLGSGAGFAAGFLAGALEAAANPTKSGSQVVDGGLTIGVLLGAPLGALAAFLNSRSRGIYQDVGLGGVRAQVRPLGSDGWRLGLRIDAR